VSQLFLSGTDPQRVLTKKLDKSKRLTFSKQKLGSVTTFEDMRSSVRNLILKLIKSFP
jgi:hypothetical protein